jgi:farnesyl-diphosphate farnesyltransferase
MSGSDADLIGPLLRDVSRSFYLTLRVLPKEIRPQISLAYLLARASDTIADTKGLPREERVAVLREMREGAVGATFLSRARAITESRPGGRSYGETALLQRLDDCYRMLAGLDEGDRQLIRQLMGTIIGGQIFDLERFPGEPLRDEELDRYTYMVAGCVGEFWTGMCQAHVPGLENLSVADGVRFGKGLQLVNVLRDIEADRRRGRQYLPRFEDYALWLDRAVEHLDAGWRYTMQIPARLWRLRLACIWPIWIGLETIARLRRSNPNERAAPVKISRGEVYAIIARSLLCVCCGALLTGHFRRLRDAALRR